jgi:hypothetical protein
MIVCRFVEDLNHLVDRCGKSLDFIPDFSWADELSPGEMQRLCFARLFYHRPGPVLFFYIDLTFYVIILKQSITQDLQY